MSDHDYGTSPTSMGRNIRTIRVSEVRAPMLERWGKRFMEMEADNAALLAVMEAADNADAILLAYWMGPEFGKKPTDKQVYEAVAELNQALAALPEHLR